MQLQAIRSNTGFTSKRDEMIAQDDNYIRTLALHKTLKKVNPERNRKINNAMFYSIPVVAGLSTALLTKGKTTLLTKELSGKAAKFAGGLKAAVGWGLFIGIADAVIGSKHLLSKKSETVKMKNPLFCVIVFILAAIALGYAYYMVTAGIKESIKTPQDIIKPIVIGTISTFLIFWSLSGLILKAVMSMKNLYVKGLNAFTFRQVSSKINTTVLSMTIYL